MRVLISQRVDMVPGRDERRDALDQAWGPTLDALLGRAAVLLPLPNRPASVTAAFDEWNPQLAVLSGGNDIGSAPERDATEAAVLSLAAKRGTPVLAVCRGMQMVQHHLGGSLARVEGHVAATHTVVGAPGTGLDPVEVNSFHDWAIPLADLATPLEPLYVHGDGTVEAARHRSLPWLAVMWHPERTSPAPQPGEWVAAWLKKVVQ